MLFAINVRSILCLGVLKDAAPVCVDANIYQLSAVLEWVGVVVVLYSFHVLLKNKILFAPPPFPSPCFAI